MTGSNAPRIIRALALAADLAVVLAACGAASGSIPIGSGGAGALASAAAAASAARESAAVAASAGASLQASASAAAETAKPTAAPTEKPTAKPTEKPATGPTAAPTPTPIIASQTCKTSDEAITVTYPAAWQTVTAFPQFNCMFFNNLPIVISADIGYPLAPIHVTESRVPFNVAVLAAGDDKYWQSASKTPLKVGGLPAFLLVAVANGAGNYPRNTERYAYYVDWGANGVIILETTGPEGDTRLAGNKLVLDYIASKIVIKPNP
jgi:hypothetical protein